MSRNKVVLLAVLFEGGLAVLAWGLGWVLGVPAFGDLHWTTAAFAWGLAATVPMLVAMILVGRSRWAPLVELRQTAEEAVAQLFSSCTIVDLALLSALAGLGEEALFRGLLQTGLAGVVGLGVALIVASVVFGLAHFISVAYAVYAALVGLYLGLLLIACDNLLVPVTAHAAYDFIALVYLVRAR